MFSKCRNMQSHLSVTSVLVCAAAERADSTLEGLIKVCYPPKIPANGALGLILYHIVSHCIISYCIVLYCIVSELNQNQKSLKVQWTRVFYIINVPIFQFYQFHPQWLMQVQFCCIFPQFFFLPCVIKASEVEVVCERLCPCDGWCVSVWGALSIQSDSFTAFLFSSCVIFNKHAGWNSSVAGFYRALGERRTSSCSAMSGV